MGDLTSTERGKCDALMLGGAVGATWACSDKQGNASHYNMLGHKPSSGSVQYSRTWAPNFRYAMIGTLLIAIPYFGGPSQLISRLDNYSHTSMRTTLSNYGLTNAWASFMNAGAPASYNPTSNAPSVSTIQDYAGDFRFNGLSLNQVYECLHLEHRNMWRRAFEPGLFGGAGVLDENVNGGTYRGRLATASARNNYPGALSGSPIESMAKELNDQDGGSGSGSNKRSAMTYAAGGWSCEQYVMMLLGATGYISRSTPGVNARIGTATPTNQNYHWMERLALAVQDMKYKTNNEYWDYSKRGKPSTNNNNWTRSWAESNYSISLNEAAFDEFIEPHFT